MAGARRSGFERLLGEGDLRPLVGSGLALAACRAGYLERRGAFDEYRLVGGRAAGREVELVARCRRYGKLRVVEIIEELFRGAIFSQIPPITSSIENSPFSFAIWLFNIT